MSGTLYVVATPIGNLEDITLRALRILREVTVIAAEDTRRTAKLLTHHGIATPTVSFHEHNARTRVPQLVARLRRNESVALVSDAGTPGVSDPGRELVQACIEAAIPVDPIPGASAVLTALVASGFPTSPVTFLGFPPSKASDRKRWLTDASLLDATLVFFEAPHRIASILREASGYLGDRPLVLARELTKVHQEFLRGTASDLVNRLNETRGEFTVVVGPSAKPRNTPLDLPQDDALANEFRHLTEIGGHDRRGAVSQLAKKYGRPSREVYARLEAVKRGVS